MTRDEIFNACSQALETSNCLLLEAATGTGKSRQAINLVNSLIESKYQGKSTSMLLLVAKTVHKQTWKDEFEKWGGIKVDNVVMECYESLRKHEGETFDFVLMDECFRGDTEILTNSGYKQFKDLTEEDLVAQFTQDGNIEFVKPIKLIKRKHSGQICKLHLGRNRYCYLTPNHNMVYKTNAVDSWRVKPVSDLCLSHFTRIPVSGKGTGNNTLLTPTERLLIATQADGTLQRHQTNESVYSIQVTKERKKEALLALLLSYDSDKYTKIKGREGTDRYMVKLPKGDAKLLNTHFSVNMGYDRANDFINEVLQWDGCSRVSENTSHYSSIIKENVDFVAAIAIQAGYKVLQSIEEDERKDTFNPIHRLFIRRKESVNTQSMTKEYLPYDDYVYCVEVPSHMIVVRSEGYSFIAGNCHHVQSETRMQLLSTLKYSYMLGLSATIPGKLKQFFKWKYKAAIVSCDIIEAIEDDVLPEPEIVLWPLSLETTRVSETMVINPKIKKPVVDAPFREIWKWKKQKTTRAIIHCTQQQKMNELNSQISWMKDQYMRTRSKLREQSWLYLCGKRLEFLADCKLQIVKLLLKKLKNSRTITFCKTIKQAETLGLNCIHSKRKNATDIYERFNQKKLHHITAVNILNENANLVDCKYAIFTNLSSSEIVQVQRIGRSLRHRHPVIIVPYYKGTREEEIVQKMIAGYNREFIRVIDSMEKL